MLRRLLASPRFYFAAAVLVALLAIWRSVELRFDPRPVPASQALATLAERSDLNVIFILIDTLRADRLGAYGYHRRTSPTLDALAAQGVLFENAVAQSSWTKCSMASLWTAARPVATGVVRYPHALPEAARLPAEILREAGFRTAGIWRNGWVDPSFGFGQGFDTYVKPRPYDREEKAQRRGRSPYALIGSDWDLTESALAFLRTFGRERFFLYLHYMDVHQYVSDKSTVKFGTTYSDIYDSAIAWVDRNVAELVVALEAHGLRDRTILAVASDHGEEFREHGGEGHARSLYREVTQTPLILSLPLPLERGIVVRERVENVDLWPTLLDLLGLEPMPHADGRSLLPRMRAAAGAPHEPEGEPAEGLAVAYLDRTWGRVGADPTPTIAVHRGRHRLIHRPHAPARDELFDLSTDPGEQTNRAEERPDELAALREIAAAELNRAPAWGEALEIELDAIKLQLLRALGYAVGGERQREQADDQAGR